MANRKQLANNVSHYEAKRPGVSRKGCALLQGLVVCGRCGRHMGLRYSGSSGDYPVYCCTAVRRSKGSRAARKCVPFRSMPRWSA